MKQPVATLIQAATLANRLVLIAMVSVVALIGLLLVPGLINPEWGKGWFYPVFAFGVPLTWVAGMATGPAAVLLYLFSGWNGFWRSAAPAVLGIVCLNFTMASIPPPPMLGAAVAVLLGALCIVPLLRSGGWENRWGVVPLLALPFLGKIPFMAFWAPLISSVLFIGLWMAVRIGWNRNPSPE